VKKIISALLLSSIVGCTNSNLDDVKAHAPEVLAQAGYTIKGYEGYQYGNWIGGSYGGAMVWYTATRKDNPTVIYAGAIQRWGDEYHIYSLRAVDALTNK